ncbi:MAG TPA: DUF4440 domain-containing protein [Geodermatophilus sp.]|nr:DUF4440 domain-containing protein [Geodermatophilus sp.]
MDRDLQRVVDRELALLSPEVRRDADAVRSLLHPDFVEYGASGRVWNRTSVPAATSGPAEGITVADLRARWVGDGVVLLTYRSEASGRRALRSSIWVRDPEASWLLLFHQGTPCV